LDAVVFVLLPEDKALLPEDEAVLPKGEVVFGSVAIGATSGLEGLVGEEESLCGGVGKGTLTLLLLSTAKALGVNGGEQAF
jgi:hypothetical protein